MPSQTPHTHFSPLGRSRVKRWELPRWKFRANEYLRFDLQESAMVVGTNSTLGSKDKMEIIFHESMDLTAGGLTLLFASKAKLWLEQCSFSYTSLSELPLSVTTERVWRITLKRQESLRMLLHCDNVKVLDFTFSGETCPDWRWKIVWARHVNAIVFPASDTASIDYGIFGGKFSVFDVRLICRSTSDHTCRSNNFKLNNTILHSLESLICTCLI